MDSIKSKIKDFTNRSKSALDSFLVFSKNRLNLLKGDKFSNNRTYLDKKLISSLSKSKIPNLRQFKYLNKVLSAKESNLLKICFFVIFINVIFLGFNFCKNHLHTSPIIGGDYTEGLIGSPKYINPLYSNTSDIDSDLSRLVFSSLFKRNENGELVNDLVDTYTVSEDKKIYTIKIRRDAKWHNGSDLTVDDVIFTFNSILDPAYKSPLRSSFSGVGVERVNDETVSFALSEPYAAFPEFLTFGILPQEIWMHISPESANLAEYNLKPIGSGPFKFKSLIKDKSGNIKTFSLERNNDYYGSEKLYIKNFIFKFYPNPEETVNAFNNNSIDGIGYLPIDAKKDLVALDSINVYNLHLPQVNAIFFNQSKNEALKDKKIRQALSHAINKGEIISRTLEGDALAIDGPIPQDSFAFNPDSKKYKFDIMESAKLITETGWKEEAITQEDLDKALSEAENDEDLRQISDLKSSLGVGTWRKKDNKYLIINLTTVENNNNIQVVEIIKEQWEKVGVKVNLSIIPVSQIHASVIKQRNFEALFYGQIIGSDPDSYAFWHSSQIGENGLNIANYSNKEVDGLLEDARLISNTEERTVKYKRFQEIIADELPAIFLYSPTYTYVQSKRINGFNIKNIYSPRDRFSNVEEWYIKVGRKLIW